MEKSYSSIRIYSRSLNDPYMNVTVGHYNAKSEDLRMLLEYSKKKISNFSKRSMPNWFVESSS